MPKASKARKKTRGRLLAGLVILLLTFTAASEALYNRLHMSLPPVQPRLVYTPLKNMPVGTLNWPSFGQSAIGLVGYDVLETHGAQLPVPTASVAKVITALAVLQQKPIPTGQTGGTLTLSQADLDIYDNYVAQGGSVVPVALGEQINEYQVLQAMLLPSANNMADTLAIWAFGSLKAYSAYANHMLASLDLTHSHVGSDASGFSPTTISTASDLVKLGELATGNTLIAGITAQSSADVPVAGSIRNINWLLGTSGINGLKTGNSDQAGGTFLFSARYKVANSQTVTLVGAVLGAPTLSEAMNGAVPLLITGEQALGTVIAVPAGQAVAVYGPAWSKPVTASTTRAISGLSWRGSIIDKPTVRLSLIMVPAAKGTLVGSIGFHSPPSSSPVVLNSAVANPSIWWRLPHP